MTAVQSLNLMRKCWQILPLGLVCDPLSLVSLPAAAYLLGCVKTPHFPKVSCDPLSWLQTDVCWWCFKVLSRLLSGMGCDSCGYRRRKVIWTHEPNADVLSLCHGRTHGVALWPFLLTDTLFRESHENPGFATCLERDGLQFRTTRSWGSTVMCVRAQADLSLVLDSKPVISSSGLGQGMASRQVLLWFQKQGPRQGSDTKSKMDF